MFRALSRLYANFFRIRWVYGDSKVYGYIALENNDFTRFEASKSTDRHERINQNWEELEKCIE